MIRRLFRTLRGVYFSLPVQLLVNQIGEHFLLLLTWAFLFLLVTNNLFTSFGVPQLLLEPEYLQRVSFASVYLIGLALGLFTLAFQMTSYISDGYKFLFIALLRHPFRVFTLNNFIIPVAFWVTYLVCFVQFQFRGAEPRPVGEVVSLVVGLLLGGATVHLLSVGYFSLTNRNALSMLGERFVRGLQNPMRMARRTRVAMEQSVRVERYITARLGIRPMPLVVRGDTRPILKVLNQNHANALLVMSVTLVVLLLIGFLQDYPVFQVPAGATVLLILAVGVMFGGALRFWFRRVGPLVFVAVLSLLFFLNGFEPFVGRHMAFGLNYRQPPAPYVVDSLQYFARERAYRQDLADGTRQLNTWLARYRRKHGPQAKPKLLIVCVTGGGLRSATWSMLGLQAVDSATGGNVRDHMRLITGASGGMIAAAYYRELMLRQVAAGTADTLPQTMDPQHVQRISSDLLNSITSTLISSSLVPQPGVQIGDRTYNRDRGYAFEQQLIRNTGMFAGRTLADYRQPERDALVPMLIFSPAIIRDGRQLLISPQPLAYLVHPARFNRLYRNEVPAVEFSRLLARHDADSLRMTTAIRMNCSFPYILPFVELPTSPPVEVMDAGVFDNFGITLAIRYLYAFRGWIERNTRGVVILQIRDSQREAPIPPTQPATLLSRLTGVLGGAYNSIAESKDFQNDDLLAYARGWFRVPMDVLELQYIPQQAFQEASLNLHLTRRERADIQQSIQNRENQRVLAMLRQLLRP